MAQTQRFTVLEPKFAVCQLAPDAPLPVCPESSSFWCLTATRDEISLVCEERWVPTEAISIERNWRALKIAGPLDFSLQGVLLSLLSPLAEMKLGVFVVSTYDTDYVLVKDFDLEPAIAALQAAGHQFA